MPHCRLWSPGCHILRSTGRPIIRRCSGNVEGTMRPEKAKLDPNRHSYESEEFEAALRRRIVGQEDGVRAVTDLYQVFRAGMSSTGRPVGNLLVPWADRLGQDAHRGSGGGNSVRRPARGDQGGLRRVPALARNREADRLASGLSGTPRNASADHAGSAGAISQEKT